MACNGGSAPPPPPPPLQIGNPPSPKFFLIPPSPQTFYSAPLHGNASAFFTHGYLPQAHVHISEAIITD